MTDPIQDTFDRVAATYDEFFLPALVSQFAPKTVDAARLAPGDRVLDVACGTGVVTIEAANRIGKRGAATGLDPNEGMLNMARTKAAGIDWRVGAGEALPFKDGHFDAVVSQFGLMFFKDPSKGLSEMWRVLGPGGRLAVAVWTAIDRNPAYDRMTPLLEDLVGSAAVDANRVPFHLGDRSDLLALAERAGIAGAAVQAVDGQARFPSLESWVRIDVRDFTLGNMIDDAGFETLLTRAQASLGDLVAPDGTFQFPISAHLLTATRP